ncbi:acylphosphatase [Halalkalibacter hemicellulosilyticus]|uniref:Acylphosphatase n=1 Tax=Halalkalibacter hemicellulosilyticusJCM 9152 TaxID=1236971 RepID=W4QCC7_9BACI|nr:acylphosphatase [Halalkalibacter hemicellulosilyticus]GAE29607.1 acylphosphatase [Halalkalibacter hemicellulosilyticusJCM 9152]
MECWLMKVYGRVQGVGFRYFTQTEALTLNINGWAKNEDDGTVTVYAIGTASSLEAFLTKVETGPPFAKVKKVTVNKQEEWTNPSTFQIR